MTVAELVILLWMGIAAWMMWKNFKLRRQIKAVSNSGVEIWGNGYASALRDEGYTKGEATCKTMERLRSVQDGGWD